MWHCLVSSRSVLNEYSEIILNSFNLSDLGVRFLQMLLSVPQNLLRVFVAANCVQMVHSHERNKNGQCHTQHKSLYLHTTYFRFQLPHCSTIIKKLLFPSIVQY